MHAYKSEAAETLILVEINQNWNCIANRKYYFSKQADAVRALLNHDKTLMNQINKQYKAIITIKLLVHLYTE